MLEIQERLSETSDKTELKEIMSDTAKRKDALETALSTAFSKDDLLRASEIITELSYLDRIIYQITDRM